MTTKEKAKEWGCTEKTVRQYCNDGIIPLAEKVGRRWQIPDDWGKPPMTRHGLCVLMDTIYQLNHGVSFDSLKWGYSDETIKAGYDYLISVAFISTIDTSKLSEELINSTVTPRGKEIIDKENAKNHCHYNVHITARANLGIISLEGGGEVSNT